MKSATKKTLATKKAVGKKAVVKKVPRKRALQSPLRGARESLAVAARESTIGVRNAMIAALVNNSPGLVSVSATGEVTPIGIFSRKFNDPLVGVDDAQMRGIFSALATAINEDRVGNLIDTKLNNPPTANARIGDVADLIQFWVDHPEVKA